MNNIRYLYVIFLMVLSTSVHAINQFDLIFEAGGVWQNRNDIQIPPDTGTRFEVDQVDEGPFFHYRLEGYYRLSQKHAFRVVYAPFDVEVTGRASVPIVFNGKSFSNNEDLTVRYQFNSYRFSYVYGFWDFGDDQLNLGFTAKVRDAKTIFSQSGVSSSYDNIGFVPLLYFEYQKPLGANWTINFTVDAAAASQGRAIDAALKARRRIGANSSLGLGVRSLEGGADNEKVFTFSWFNYALIELKLGF